MPYFILKGKEKVIVIQEKNTYNTIYTYRVSSGGSSSSSLNTAVVSEIRSISIDTSHSTLVSCKYDNGQYFFSLPYISTNIPFYIIFLLFREKYTLKELGVKEGLCEYFSGLYSISSCEGRGGGGRELDEIKIDKNGYIYTSFWEFVQLEVFPHLGVFATDFQILLQFSMLLTSCAQLVLNPDEPGVDKDNIINKRYETAGTLLHELIKSLLKRFIKQMQGVAIKRNDFAVSSIVSLFSSDNLITQCIRTCMNTGNWSLSNLSYSRTGVCQIFSRLNYLSALSYSKRVNLSIGRNIRTLDIRQIHPSSIGFIDSSESPDSVSIGIVKNLTLSSIVSIKFNKYYLISTLKRYLTDDLFIVSKNAKGLSSSSIISARVYVNNQFVGFALDLYKFYKAFKELRARKVIYYQISICIRQGDVYVFCDEGRLLRPFFQLGASLNSLEALSYRLPKMEFTELLEDGIVAYYDFYEIQMYNIAMYLSEIAVVVTPMLPSSFSSSSQQDQQLKLNTMLCEIHPSTILGECSSLIPYISHTPAPRSVYVTGHLKQAISYPLNGLELRCDTSFYTLTSYAQSLIKTSFYRESGVKSYPYGCNLIVAIMPYYGLNSEDGIIFNRSSIERGVFRTYIYKTYSIYEKKYNSQTYSVICMPSPEVQKSNYNYSKLDPSSGVIREGEEVDKNDIIVGFVNTNGEKNITSDHSLTVNSGEEGIVDRVFITTNAEGFKYVRIKVRIQLEPKLGDKCVSLAQKCTLTAIVPSSDLPFSADTGIPPDVIINPLAFPSRMTINYLITAAQGKLLCSSALTKLREEKEEEDCTSFNYEDHSEMERICNRLIQVGLEPHGEETYIDGHTGEELEAKVFTGILYYNRLKHIASYKAKIRKYYDNKDIFTRLPLGGKMNALRFGHMEIQASQILGLSSGLKEKFFDLADPFVVNVCAECGMKGSISSSSLCAFCNSKEKKRFNLPFTSHLLFTELEAMGIKIKIK